MRFLLASATVRADLPNTGFRVYDATQAYSPNRRSGDGNMPAASARKDLRTSTIWLMLRDRLCPMLGVWIIPTDGQPRTAT